VIGLIGGGETCANVVLDFARQPLLLQGGAVETVSEVLLVVLIPWGLGVRV